jgi:hypothetical protein
MLTTEEKNTFLPATAGSYVRWYGFKSLAEVVEISGWPRSTLIDMFDKHPVRFDTVLLGCRGKLDYRAKAVMDQVCNREAEVALSRGE